MEFKKGDIIVVNRNTASLKSGDELVIIGKFSQDRVKAEVISSLTAEIGGYYYLIPDWFELKSSLKEKFNEVYDDDFYMKEDIDFDEFPKESEYPDYTFTLRFELDLLDMVDHMAKDVNDRLIDHALDVGDKELFIAACNGKWKYNTEMSEELWTTED